MTGMDDTQLAAIVSAEIEDAISFIDSDIGPLRAGAVDRYFGRPYGDEEDGRSHVVSRDVHDTVNAILPSLMRVFFGSENVVEFAPESEEDVPMAEQATDYVNYIVTVDNDGFEVFLAAIKNALREKVGFIKWWWDESYTVTTSRYTGLADEVAITALVEDIDAAEEAEIVDSSQDEDGSWSVTLRLKKRQDRARIAAVPPDELIIGRRMKTLSDEGYVGHRTEKRVSELVAMGYDRDLVISCASDGSELDGGDERQARAPYRDLGGSASDDSSRLVLYVESYINVDQDGDGIAELRRICTIGGGFKIVANDPVDERPIADLQCDPEPHAFFGESITDKVVDVQRLKTNALRAWSDGLAQSIFPRTVVGRGGNINDAMNTEVGAVLRAEGSASDAYFFAAAPDTSRAALPLLTYMDELRENRTGMSKVSMGLDAEALQNTTATAANGQFSRSQERIELIARIMASGVRRLYRGLLKITTENQRKERVVKLRNKWTPVDPRQWKSGMDVVPNVGLGGGTNAEKASLLTMIAAKQEMIIVQAGINNPLVTPKQYYNTLSRLIETGGFRDPQQFFTDPDSEEARARMDEAAQQPPPVDPKVLEAQGKLQLEQERAASDQDMARQRAEADLVLQRERSHAEMAQRAEQHAMELEFRRQQASAELELKREEMMLEASLKREAIHVNAAAKSTTIDGPSQGGEPG